MEKLLPQLESYFNGPLRTSLGYGQILQATLDPDRYEV